MTKKKQIRTADVVNGWTATAKQVKANPLLHRIAPGTSKTKEDRLVEALDQKRMIERYMEHVEPLLRGKMDVQSFFGAISPRMASQLYDLAVNGDSDKVKLDAIRDILDRAGFSKVQKVAMATASANDPKDQLVSMIEGLVNKSKDMPIEIVDDEEDKG